MGNCVRCGRKKAEADGVPGEKKKKGLKGKLGKKSKEKNKENKKGAKVEGGRAEHRNGVVEEHLQDTAREEPCKVVRLAPLEEETVRAYKDYSLGPQDRKVLRLVLPYIPKKQWGKLREVCKTWAAVVDGEWARMHTVHLPELVQHGTASDRNRLIADHVSSKCQLSRSIVAASGPERRPIDLSDVDFWRRLLPRTNDLTALRLHDVHLPKYFFTEFLPRCKNLEILDVIEAPSRSGRGCGALTTADRERLRETIGGLEKLRSVRLDLNDVRFESKNANSSVHGPIPTPRESKIKDSTPAPNSYHVDPPLTNANYIPRDVDAILNKSSSSHTTSFAYDNVPLSPKVLKALSTCPNLTSLSFDLNLDHLNPYDDHRAIHNFFSVLEHLRDLRVNIITNERNVYETLRTLAMILKTVADYSRKLNALKLIRLPDPMGIDKPLATDIGTAFVKLNDETQLKHLHVCVLAPPELFHVWSLPWPAFNHLQTLTLTDCNLYPERPRGIDLEGMRNLTTFTLCSDSLDDDMLMRVFAQPHLALTDLTLEPGPKGIGKGGLRTVALACQNLRRLTISYGRTRDQNKFNVDVHGWTAFFRVVPDTLKTITLIDIDRGYLREEIEPVSRQCPQIEVRPIYQKASFDTYASTQPISNGNHYGHY